MNNNVNKPTPDYSPIYRMAAVMLAIAVIVTCYAIARVEDFLLRIILFSVAGLVAFIAFIFISAALTAKRMSGKKINYFLYDKKTKRDMPLDALTFEELRRRIQKYMSMFSRGGKLYVGDLFDERINIPNGFRPLFCYELLYELAESGADCKRLGLFLSFGNECADAFSEQLNSVGEFELAQKLRFYFSEYLSGNQNVADFYDFLNTKKDALRANMMKYTKEHIEEF